MTYVLDTNSFSACGHYFPSRFPSFWQSFNQLVRQGDIISVREVRNELESQSRWQHILDWVQANRAIFLLPDPQETQFVAQIFAVPHFRQLIGHKQRLAGRPVADPFVIASAHHRAAVVVTEESHRPNAARIPNVCDHFGIECISLELLMEREGWTF
jgi:hypothetical protein